jgi:hypothetical protein
VPAVLLERDRHHPTPAADAALADELDRLAAAVQRGRARRPTVPTARPAPAPITASAATVAARPGLAAARARLAAGQRAFVRAVTAGGGPPPGFDHDDLDAVASVLADKRARAVAGAFPALADTGAFEDGFTAWAATHPSPDRAAATDAVAFLDGLPRHRRTAAAAAEVTRAELATVRRRAVVRRAPDGTVVGLRLAGRVVVRRLGRR